MTTRLLLTWDYDSALGMANTSYPYDWDAAKVDQELRNLDAILDLAEQRELPMTFACVGFAAEPGPAPFHVPEKIREIVERGHEVASHSWRHEWFPFLEREQIRRSLARSRLALERCVGEGRVRGFVPPFSRPMSWYAKGALSRGDRAWGRPGADLGSLVRMVAAAGYAWCRVSWRPVWRRLRRGDALLARLERPWTVHAGVACIPQHYTGFDEGAERLLDEAVRRSVPLVLVGHPAGLSRGRSENVRHLESFLDRVDSRRERGEVEPVTVISQLGAAVVGAGPA